MSFKIIATIVLALCVAAPAVAEGPKDIWDDAFAAMKRDDYPTAVRLFRSLAELGYPSAQFQLGFLYRRGDGVPQDYAEAAKWLQLAANGGHAWAQSNLAFMYRDAEGMPQDFIRAHMWWNLASAGASAKDRGMYVEYRDELAKKMTSAQIAEAQKLARDGRRRSSFLIDGVAARDAGLGTMKSETWLAVYAAVVATAAFGLNFRAWFEKLVRLNLSLMPDAILIGGHGADDDKNLMAITVINRAARPPL
ncbi:tetratricopeptide repeat protein [Bradyrhizobium sp. RT6a]|uniref:tetratricopeptide repeat protein n=1 Tax=unclassified Bradyrhizobium TaxID=2631580 RepID=UPI003390CD9D